MELGAQEFGTSREWVDVMGRRCVQHLWCMPSPFDKKRHWQDSFAYFASAGGQLARLYNLLAEKRKELQQLQRVSEGLEHAAEVFDGSCEALDDR